MAIGIRAEVAIVGGGPAGAAAAALLARAGADVVVLDRAQFPRGKPCAEYLSPQASRLLHELGVLARIERAGGAHLTGMRIVAPDGTAFSGDFAAHHGFRGFRDAGIALPRTVLDNLLLDRARELGARVETGFRVRDVVRHQGRVTGVVGDNLGTAFDVKAPLVVGADGLRSVVGRRLGLVRAGRWPRRVALVAHYTGVAGVGSHGEMHVGPRGYAGLADVGGQLVNVAVVIPHADAWRMRGAPAAFMDRYLAATPTLAERFHQARRVDAVLATGPFNQRASPAWAPGAALVGDAADFFDPFTGEGIYAALRGAELLLPYAWDAARSPIPSRSDVALAAYQRARRDTFGDKWRVERLIGTAVAFPALFNRVAAALRQERGMADLLVGVAGDFVPARRVLNAGFLWRLLRGMLRAPGHSTLERLAVTSSA